MAIYAKQCWHMMANFGQFDADFQYAMNGYGDCHGEEEYEQGVTCGIDDEFKIALFREMVGHGNDDWLCPNEEKKWSVLFGQS